MDDSSPHSTDKKKRASKRYPYPRAAQCEFSGQVIEVQLLNISTTGVQFAAKTQIKSNDPIRIQWKDATFGSFDPTFLIAREIHKPENKEFTYYYGVQYFNLSQQTKDNLLQLLKNFKEESTKEIQHEIQKITPLYLMDVMGQGNVFIQTAIAGKALPYFDSMIAEIKDYEREAFGQGHLSAKCLQRLVSHNFNCSIIKIITPLTAESVELLPAFFEKVNNEFSEIIETESLVESELKKLVESKLAEDIRKPIQQHLNESSNRLFYSKQATLQTLVEVLGPVVATSEQLSERFLNIKAEYEKMAISNASFQEDIQQVYSRKTKKPEEFSKVDFIVDVPDLSEKKPRYFLFLNILFLLIAGGIYGYMQIDHMMHKKSLVEEIGLQIPILNYNRIGSQIDLVFDTIAWEKLPAVEKYNEFKKIAAFLVKDKRAISAVIFNDHHDMIQVLYEDREPRQP